MVQVTYKLYSRLDNTQFSNFFPDFEGFAQYVQNEGKDKYFEASNRLMASYTIQQSFIRWCFTTKVRNFDD